MAPAITLAHPQIRSAFVDPRNLGHELDPRLRFVTKRDRHAAGWYVSDQEIIPVLQPIELLNGDGLGIHPVESGEICVSRVAWRLQPARASSGRGNDADPHRRVRGADFRIRITRRGGIQVRGVIDERVDAHAGRVELPVRNRLSVRTPLETVTQREFFLVHPVRRAIDRRVGSIARELHDFAIGELFDVDVVSVHVGDACAVGRELRKHEGRFRNASADFLQGAACDLENPVIAARVIAPDFPGVREYEQPFAVSRPVVVVNFERLLPAGGY